MALTLAQLEEKVNELEMMINDLGAYVRNSLGTSPTLKTFSLAPTPSGTANNTLMDKENEIQQLQQDLDTVKTKLGNAYSAEDLTGYLGGLIDSFNSKATVTDSPVGYMVSNVDLELKAQIDNDGKDLKLVSADPTVKSAESMSTIKISVRAVPK